MRALLRLAAFAAAFVATCLALGSRLPLPEMEDASPKWKYFRENMDRFDTVFIGSSRFRHQIVPEIFDAHTGAASLNLGCSGMWPPESWHYLRRLLALHPPRLRWVFIELMDGKTRLDPRDAGTLRMMYWHDWRHTCMAWRAVLESTSRTPAEKRWLCAVHARLFLRRLANPGRGAELLRERWRSPKKKRAPEWIATAGFEPLPPEGALRGPALADYEQRVSALKKHRPEIAARPGLVAALRDLAAEVRRAGAQPIFVAAPTVSIGENFTGLPEDLAILFYNDPAQAPRLYEAGLHYDAGHLNEKGAAVFTGLLARDFAARWPRTP